MVAKHSLAAELNGAIWQGLYCAGKSDLRYPNDILVRLGARLFGESRGQRVLDFGFGTGANLLHFAEAGFAMHGVEVSEHALARTQEKLRARGRAADLHLVRTGERLPFVDSYFHIVYAWQVLYYNDWNGWRSTVCELERVTEDGGLILVATAAPGDVSQVEAEPLGDHVYRSRVAGQEGCILTIPDREALPHLFPRRLLEIGELGFRFGATATRHWIVSYRKAGV
jgi:SAM-dependent methyltransferase